MTKYCPNCGIANDDSAKHCLNCGNKFPEWSVSRSESEKYAVCGIGIIAVIVIVAAAVLFFPAEGTEIVSNDIETYAINWTGEVGIDSYSYYLNGTLYFNNDVEPENIQMTFYYGDKSLWTEYDVNETVSLDYLYISDYVSSDDFVNISHVDIVVDYGMGEQDDNITIPFNMVIKEPSI